MKDLPQDPSEAFEWLKPLLNRTAEENAVRLAATADWVGLIEQAMACNPAPLRELLRQIGTSRTNLYPQAMLDFLALMERYKPKTGRPCKDGYEAIRAAAKAWRVSYLKSTVKIVADAHKDARKVSKHRSRRMTKKIEEGLISIQSGSISDTNGETIKRLYADESATNLALKVMANAGFGKSAESLKNEIYPRKKGTTKEPK